MVGFGLMVTVAVKLLPGQLPMYGVTVYVATAAEEPVRVSVCEIDDCGVFCADPPVKPVPVGVLHVYVVPAGTTPSSTFVGTTLNATPVQPLPVTALIAGAGETIIETEVPLAEQEPCVTTTR